MAGHMFLKLDGVKGETQDKDHPDEIEVVNWGWGMSQPGNFHTGSGGGAGKLMVNDLSIQKFVDHSTPTLQQFCCAGKHISSATLTCRKASGEKSIPYLRIELHDVVITHHALNGIGSLDRINESLTLHFRQFKTIYLLQDAKGVPKSGPQHAYNIAANKPA